MNNHPVNPSLPDDKPLPRLRAELTATSQMYDGQPYWVVKDPMCLRYFRFNREEYFILEQLRRGTTVEQLKQAHRREFKTDALNNQDIGLFIQALSTKNLLSSEHPRRDQLLYDAATQRRRFAWLGRLSNFMFIKIPLVDPDRFFNRIIPRMRFIWSRGFLLFYLLLLATAMILIARRWNEFTAMFGSHLFTIRNLPMLLVTFWLVKAIHELGHGLTCKYYGGEVHDMGFLLLVFNPMLYCNITDSWTFIHKWRRLLVGAGGILAELLIAALAAVVWYFTDLPGFVHSWMFNVVIICSISTIMFNANPLLKFDGYYILMDMIEVPNLRQRASKLMNRLFIRGVLGGDTPEAPEEHRFRYLFPMYAVCSMVYRWFIIFSLSYVAYRFMKQFGMEVFGRLLMVISIATMLIFPLTKTTVMLVRRRHSLGVSHARLMVLLAALAAFVGGALFLPMEQTVTLNFILEPAQVQWVRTEVPGQFHWQASSSVASPGLEGKTLKAADTRTQPVAQLENQELQLQRIQLAAEMDIQRMAHDYYKGMGLTGTVHQLEERLKALKAEAKHLDDQLTQLNIKPPFTGQVLSSDRQMAQLEGAYLQRGAPVMMLADTAATMVARVWVSEKTWARVFKKDAENKQNAELLLYAFPDRPFHGHVVRVNQHCEDSMGPFGEKMALSNLVGGEVLTKYDHETGRYRPIEPVYEVTVELDSVPPAALPYMSGRVQLACGKATLYQWTRDSLLRFISPEVRL
ncbi:MAG: HlyD family efflux transporter periplasmic adaptor subunit [Sedimentisphaerales bacterium]|nr:HlyD family efflux transporter periplasmic adaptor subunit [Sedimentisphaerales bacterium]